MHMNRELLERFLKGETTPAENQQVELWLQDQPENWLENLMEQGWEQPSVIMPEEEKAEMIAGIMSHTRSPWKGFIRIAALVAGLLVTAGGAWYFVQGPEKVNLVAVKVPFHTTKKLTLPDNTVITLNAGSILTYPERFIGDTREITLEGEGFFEVATDAGKPFIIHAGGLNTTVLGTSFNITAYRNSPQLSVTVLTGKVAVMDTLSQKSVTVLPNQRATFNPDKATLITSIVDKPENAIAWSEGKLIFEETPLAEVAERLSYKYNVQIVLVGKNLSDCRFNGEFDTEPLEEILKIITTLTKTKIKREGTMIHLSGKGCK
ncbi:DUF4974 domain-containing protein [Chitinophaga sp. SYP-B3965]|uniref:FecR family protein n=1 Tax=Chitinophaga sp. SYP-B3965 TaxID=2663120 RepID=UPI00129A0ABC|nr:FecR domain-containing protein [Chitinophaga sp. SYP-B3965]MRG47269.1 DUF4974 domain-containing protein [Chitinophaga sp. SYP-B3965]